MIRVGVVGVGKMGLSHVSMLRAHPDVELAGICDSNRLLLDVLRRQTGMATYTDLDRMLGAGGLDALVVATPTGAHHGQVSAALGRGVHVFCEKPLTLSGADSRNLAEQARARSLVTQVGYHNRFVATFAEARRLLQEGVIGRVSHVRVEAQGPVVLRRRGSTWRSRRDEGGGCLYDYAAHPLDLLAWCLGPPRSVSGTVLGTIFSSATEDEVYTTLRYGEGVSAQLSVNWSDESARKMTTRMTVWGTGGRITVDRQECQVYLREGQSPPTGYSPGWNVRYTTELTQPVWFYVRGEEYSAQLDHFVKRILGQVDEVRGTDFASAAATDDTIEAMIADAAREPLSLAGGVPDIPDVRRASRAARASTIARRLTAVVYDRASQLRSRRTGGA